MKTYLELLKNDYKYLNDLRYYIRGKKNIYNLEFDPILLRTISDYYVTELDYHKTIINILNVHYLYFVSNTGLQHEEDNNSKRMEQHIIKDISEHKKAIIDIIDECTHNLSDAMNKENANG